MSKQPKTINVTGKTYHIMPAFKAAFIAKHPEMNGCTHCAFWVDDDAVVIREGSMRAGSGRCDRSLAVPPCSPTVAKPDHDVVYVRRRDYRAHATLLELQEMGL